MSEEPRNEAEFLERESRLAREALQRLRSEMLDSLRRTADVDAWTERYPWQSLSAAAVAGLGTGWALGSTFRRKGSTEKSPHADQTVGEQTTTDEAAASQGADAPPAASRLVSGLGTLTGALASAAFAAAADALKDVVSDSIHSALHPEPDAESPATDETVSPGDTSSSQA